MGTIKDRNGRDLIELLDLIDRDEKNTWKNCTKKILMNQINTIVWWSDTQSQTFWTAKSSGLRKHCC